MLCYIEGGAKSELVKSNRVPFSCPWLLFFLPDCSSCFERGGVFA